jgi:hypothetical protein
MVMETDTTFRVVELGGRHKFGRTALTPELAKLVPGDFDRAQRLGIEQTDWEEDFGKKRPKRTVLIEAEDEPGQWTLGASMPPEEPTY